MPEHVTVGGISVEVLRKPIKNLHLSVYPPTGAVRVSAPESLSSEAIRLFAVTKLDWIRGSQRLHRLQEREPEREYLDRESHYLWGRRYLLKIVETEGAGAVTVEHSRLVLHVRAGATTETKAAVMSAWYRGQLRDTVLPLIEKWQAELGVECRALFVRQMKTRWGSCNPVARTIRLNTELAKKAPQCLEYIVVHELAHMADPSHGRRFQRLLDLHYPGWPGVRELLNASPISHASWVTLNA